MHIDQVVLVDAPKDVQRVQTGDGVLERCRHLLREQRRDRGLDLAVAGDFVNAQLFLAHRLPIRVRGRLD